MLWRVLLPKVYIVIIITIIRFPNFQHECSERPVSCQQLGYLGVFRPTLAARRLLLSLWPLFLLLPVFHFPFGAFTFFSSTSRWMGTILESTCIACLKDNRRKLRTISFIGNRILSILHRVRYAVHVVYEPQ